jgi:zinc transport system substrate-binding protein
LLLAPACGRGGASHADVVASFYPLAFAAEQIGGPGIKVTNLTGPGVEPHELELSPRQVDEVEGAKVVLVLGKDFQPAVERVAKRNKGRVAVAEQLRIQGPDPHVWLDPVLMQKIVAAVATALDKPVPSELKAALTDLDRRYRTGLAHCARHEIVTAHEAFGRLAARYGLTQKAIAGFSPESEPNPARLAELADLIRRDGVTTVFTEELVSPRVADTLAREAGVKTEVLNPIEGLSKPEIKAHANYVTLMDANLKKLQLALGCV